MIKCLIYLAIIGVLSFLLGRILPKAWFKCDKIPFKSFKFEKEGKLYKKFKIQKWQNKVPDMSKICKGMMPEKKITDLSKDNLELMIQETCIAEFIHVILCVAGCYCMKLWRGTGGVVVFILNVLGNLPFILIQRYNRPRLMKLKKVCEH